VSLALKIIIGIAAVGVGVWLGLPGRYEQTPEDLERDMEWQTGRSYRVKRQFTPLAWVQRKLSARGQRSRPRQAFHLESPEPPKGEDRGKPK
jgi:hypothetical protein